MFGNTELKHHFTRLKGLTYPEGVVITPLAQPGAISSHNSSRNESSDSDVGEVMAEMAAQLDESDDSIEPEGACCYCCCLPPIAPCRP